MFSPVYTQTRASLARIRCLQECIECFRDARVLPEALCYVPHQLEFKLSQKDASAIATPLSVYKKPDKTGECIATLTSENCSENRVFVAGISMCNSQGQWLKLEVSDLVLLVIFSPLHFVNQEHVFARLHESEYVGQWKTKHRACRGPSHGMA